MSSSWGWGFYSPRWLNPDFYTKVFVMLFILRITWFRDEWGRVLQVHFCLNRSDYTSPLKTDFRAVSHSGFAGVIGGVLRSHIWPGETLSVLALPTCNHNPSQANSCQVKFIYTAHNCKFVPEGFAICKIYHILTLLDLLIHSGKLK